MAGSSSYGVGASAERSFTQDLGKPRKLRPTEVLAERIREHNQSARFENEIVACSRDIGQLFGAITGKGGTNASASFLVRWIITG